MSENDDSQHSEERNYIMGRKELLSETDRMIVEIVSRRWLNYYSKVREDWINRNGNPICASCGAAFEIADTRHWQLHNLIHTQSIDEKYPSKNTICLCVSCHRKVQKECYERPDGSLICY